MLTINLSSIQSNWRYLVQLAPVKAKVAGVIKANAYGLGAEQIGKALWEAGCREFFVASLEEALLVKKSLPGNAIIYVLGGFRNGDEQIFIDSGLIPVLGSLAAVKRWSKLNSMYGRNDHSVIKINTGMTRLGLNIDEFKSLCLEPALLKACNPVLMMSHLACADKPNHPLNKIQQELFSNCALLAHPIFPKMRFSLANSSGIFLGDTYHFDLLRPGAALYGIAPQKDVLNPMKPVVSLRLPIIQVRTLDERAGIGYGSEIFLEKGGRIVVVAGGYADGLNRTLGANPEGSLHGWHVKSVGRMSMDLTMFDISNVPLSDEQLLQSSIEVINDQFSLDYLSEKNDLLGYEVLTSLGSRYKREYINEVSNA
ncbi:MAG TPA: alanine racemase [Cellvibrio sp.]|nr:alanine racemase [Cellvibrio sp.]